MCLVFIFLAGVKSGVTIFLFRLSSFTLALYGFGWKRKSLSLHSTQPNLKGYRGYDGDGGDGDITVVAVVMTILMMLMMIGMFRCLRTGCGGIEF